MLGKFKTSGTNRFTHFAIIIISCYSFLFTDYWRFWSDDKTPFSGDAAVSYWYVPATFINKSYAVEHPQNIFVTRNPEGFLIPKYTYGMGLMYTPFFFVGHGLAYLTDKPMDGYSLPYFKAIHYGCIIYVLLGLLILGKILRRYFSDPITAVTLILLFFATNLMIYTLMETERVHGSLFFMTSLLLWFTIKWYEKPTIMNSLAVGLTIGISTMVRPTDIIMGLIFVLYGVTSFSALKERFLFYRKKFWLILIISISFFLTILPQIILWKACTGSYLYYSYVREKFFWGDPKIMHFLFSYRNGWFLYTPTMLFAFIGLFAFRKKFPEFAFGNIVYIILGIYILSSWWCWWYIGFGMRSMVQTMPVMAFGLAGILTWIRENKLRETLKLPLKYAAVTLLSFFICLNLLQSYQFKIWLLNADSMNSKTYWALFCKLSWTQEEVDNYSTLLTPPDNVKAINGKR